ncbi:MAG: DNA polymerase I [Patescibacteria group bacterium]
MSKTDKELFILIDSNALIHRGFHAIPHLSTQDGTPTNAAYGFTMTLLAAIKELKPTHIAAAFDRPEPTFRHIAYQDYKAHRTKAPDELYQQIPICKDILDSLNIPIFEQAGLEADDIIGILAQQIKKLGISVIIVTGDMDSLQLVDDKVKVYTLKRGLKDTVIYNPQSVKLRYGFEPKLLIDYKALRGDPSDNIPGVPGIGEKTATTLIKQFGPIEQLYDFLEKNPDQDKIKGSLKDKLLSARDQAFLSKKLATIILDQPLPNFDAQKCLVQDYDQKKATDIFNSLEFKSLIPRLPQPHKTNTDLSQQTPTKSNFNNQLKIGNSLEIENWKLKIADNLRNKKYQTVDSIEKLKDLLPSLRPGFTFDTETSSLDLFDQKTKLVGISLAIKPHEAYYLPLNHQPKTSPPKPNSPSSELKIENCDIENSLKIKNYKLKINNLPLQEAINLLKPLFADPLIPKTAQNLKFDLQALKLINIEVAGPVFDTMLASYLLNPNHPNAHKLDHLSLTFLDHRMIPITDLIGTGSKQISFDRVSIEDATIYSAEDADITNLIQEKLKTQLDKQKLTEIYEKIELPLINVLANIEQNGFLLDINYLHQFHDEITKRIDKLEKEIHQTAGREFNISSTRQLASVLFDVLNLSRQNVKKTKTGISTAASELEKLKNLHPIIPLIQEFRLLTKLDNTYIATLPDLVKSDGRIHANFNQTITATGRLSSSNPNLQNIPVKTEIRQKIRRAFIAPPGFQLIAADYSQIELRLMAHIAKEPNMTKAFLNHEDIHCSTASLIYKVPLDQVTDQMRYTAKTINFSIIYGAGPRNISGQLGISFNEAKDFIANYFTTFPQVKDYMEKAINYAQANGYSQTLFGRRRPVPDLNSRAPQIKAQSERIAINTPIQGTAADIIKLAMINIYKKISRLEIENWKLKIKNTADSNTNTANTKNSDLPIKLLSQVHDELIFEVANDHIKDVTKLIRHEMENVCQLSVPLKVDIEIGKNWGEMNKIN